MQAATGCRILAIGDDKQCQAVEAGDVIDLFRRAIPDQVPELLETVRQLGDEQKAIAGLFRDGKPEAVDSDEAARVFRACSAHRSDLMPPTIPI